MDLALLQVVAVVPIAGSPAAVARRRPSLRCDHVQRQGDGDVRREKGFGSLLNEVMTAVAVAEIGEEGDWERVRLGTALLAAVASVRRRESSSFCGFVRTRLVKFSVPGSLHLASFMSKCKLMDDSLDSCSSHTMARSTSAPVQKAHGEGCLLSEKGCASMCSQDIHLRDIEKLLYNLANLQKKNLQVRHSYRSFDDNISSGLRVSIPPCRELR